MTGIHHVMAYSTVRTRGASASMAGLVNHCVATT
jgi:hypothetical protein